MKDWSRKFYTANQNFPDASKQEVQKATWNKVLDSNPSLGEFSTTVPTAGTVDTYREFLIQSEFKKPYEAESYEEMEYAGPPATASAPEIEPVFTVFATQEGVCDGDFNLFTLTFSHRAISIEIVVPSSDPAVSYVLADPPNFNKIQVLTPETPEYNEAPIQFKATMVDDATGKTGTALTTPGLLMRYVAAPACPTLWLLLNFGSSDGWNRFILWDFTRGEVPTNIPKQGGGFCEFPCTWSDMEAAVSGFSYASVRSALHKSVTSPRPVSSSLVRYSPPALPMPKYVTVGIGETIYNVNWRKSTDMTPWPGATESINYTQDPCQYIVNGSEATLQTSDGPVDLEFVLNGIGGFYINQEIEFGFDQGLPTELIQTSMTYSQVTQYWRQLLYWCPCHPSPCPECYKCSSWGRSYILADYWESRTSRMMFGNEELIPAVEDSYGGGPYFNINCMITKENIDILGNIKEIKSPEAFFFTSQYTVGSADFIPHPGEPVPDGAPIPWSPAWLAYNGSYVPDGSFIREPANYASDCRVSTYYAPAGSPFLYDDGGVIKISGIDFDDLNRNHYLEDMINDYKEDMDGPNSGAFLYIHGDIMTGAIV